MILVLLIVSLGTHALLLFKVFHEALWVVSVVEELNLTVIIGYTFFGLLIAIIVCSTIVSHYT